MGKYVNTLLKEEQPGLKKLAMKYIYPVDIWRNIFKLYQRRITKAKKEWKMQHDMYFTFSLQYTSKLGD